MDFAGVLRKISPAKNEREQVSSAIAQFLKNLATVPGATIRIGGSFEKDTWISGLHDIDVFVCFENRLDDGKISDTLEKHLKKKKIGFTRVHGSRDYFQLKSKNFNFELIPVLDISKSSQARNITDASILHAKWVRKNLSKQLTDEVRLLKAFLAACDCYGAESHIQGFSGYVCEILVVYYGSFEKVLKASLKWKQSQLIDVSGSLKGKNPMVVLNQSKVQSPIIVVDPVDSNRNAAAALSKKTLDVFRNNSFEFLKKPDGSFFERELLTAKQLADKLASKENSSVVVELIPLGGKPDITGSKVVKVSDFLLDCISRGGFNVVAHAIAWNELPLVWFKIKGKSILQQAIFQGPLVSDLVNTARFRKSHKHVFEKDGRLYARENRKFTIPKELVRQCLRQKYVLERIKKVKSIEAS